MSIPKIMEKQFSDRAGNGNLNPAEQARHDTLLGHFTFVRIFPQREAVSRNHDSLHRKRVPDGTLFLWSG